ncbi:thermosome subunit [Candidatus Bathyarchaeota archaeon]|nr:MAG: thermosome subunit [Candidatus Bathyarchaeota archaeon]
MSYLANQQVLILKEGSNRNRGKDAQRSNISAARIVSEVVKTTLGPRGMDKMLVDSLGDVTVTSDGATVLDELDVQHPAAKMLVEIAKTQDDEVGDGTTSVVVLAGELLKRAELLLDKGLHPTVINAGFKKAAEKAREILNELGKPVDLKDTETIEKRGDAFSADIENIQLVKKEGKSLLDTALIKGVIVDKEVVHPGMPKRIEKAKIALLDTPLEIEKTEFSAEIKISNPQQMQSFLDEETKLMKDMVEKIKKSGANVVLCQKGIDEVAQSFMAKNGILAARRIKKSDIEKLSRATGARIITNLEDIRSADLGFAGLVEERKVGDDKMVFIEDSKDPKSVSILIRAGLERLVDEAERALKDALSVIIDVVKKNKIVAGGGAIEIELAKRIRDLAPKIGGREQLAVEAFADSLESIPRTLSDNAGLEQIDILVALRAAHENKGLWSGINVHTGQVSDMWKEGVLEPVKVKEHAIGSAVEVASMILRIDDVIAAAKPPPPPKGGPPPD